MSSVVTIYNLFFHHSEIKREFFICALLEVLNTHTYIYLNASKVYMIECIGLSHVISELP
jgi:hypothetical protein